MLRTTQKGTVLITLIVAMTLMAALGAGIYRLTTSSSFSEFLANKNDNAYDLARAGIRYGVDLRTFTFPATTFLMPDADHTFTVQITGGVITSTGIVNPGTFLEARRSLTYDASWAPAPIPGVISFAGDMPSFGSPIVNNPLAIQPSQDGKTVNLGGGVTDSYGSLWYQGSSSVGSCSNGACSFNAGIRAYFDFTFVNEDYSADSTNSADGFTFAVISAINNTRDRTGGAAPGNSQGELMGYAGPDDTADSLGLRPPKMALEFDTYPNNTSPDVCASGSRNDPSPFSNHAALMFWGDRTISGTCSGGYPKGSFDDNRHGAGGSSGDPINTPTSSDSGYYQGANRTCKSSSNTCNWMEDGYTYSARVEIVRPSAANGSGTYDYQINAWILLKSSVPQLLPFQDVTTPYTASAPQIIKTISLSQADHDALSRIYFGFTEATGGRTGNITLSDLRVSFPQNTGDCSFGVSPANATFTGAGGPGTTAVTTTAACPWWSAAADPAYTSWLHVTSGASGTGNGTVSYTVDANAGSARTGYMTIAGLPFTVTQGVVCTYEISPSSASPGAAAVTGSTASVTAGAGCAWTATSNNAWITITAGGTGTGNGTVTYSVSTNTGSSSRTGTMTIGGRTFTVTQAGGCAGYRVWNNTGNTWDFRVTGQSCHTSVTNGSEITTSTSSTQLQPGETLSRHTTAGGGCSSAVQGQITYADAVNADTNNNCRVNYNSGDTAGNR